MTSKEEDYKSAIESVEKGDESAKTKLAWYKLSGVGGCEIDTNGAVALLEERVKAYDTEAMWMLGVCYEFGIGCKQDIERAEELYKESSNKKNNFGKVLLENERRSGGLATKRLLIFITTKKKKKLEIYCNIYTILTFI